MSYAIGKRINEIRLEKKINQEEIANALGISRQRFARIENGQSDISYDMLLKTADFFAVPVSDITSADEQVDLQIYFRDFESSDRVKESVGKIVDIIRTFHAHEKLYNRMKVKADEV